MKKFLLVAATSLMLLASMTAFAVQTPPGCYDVGGTLHCTWYGL